MPNAITKAALQGLAAALFSMALAGCQTPLPQGRPEPPYQVGGGASRAEDEQPSATPAPEANPDSDYEYRGGRDPITGKADKQM